MTRPDIPLPEPASPVPGPARRPRGRAYFVPKQRSKLRRWITATSQKTGRLLGRLLFDAEGRPRALLRSLLFDAYQRPRPGMEGIVFKEPGRPRRSFAAWLEQADANLPPLVADLPFPAPPTDGRRRVFVVAERGVAMAAPLIARLARDHAVAVLLLDGEAGGELPAPVVPVDVAGAPASRAVLLDALALRAAGDRPLFAVTLGLGAADAADAMEQRNIPVVAVVDLADAEASRNGAAGPVLERVLERASAIVFPSSAAREAALVAMPRFAARRRMLAIEAPRDAGAEKVAAIGREIGEEVDNELAIILATRSERLELLTIPRYDDPPGEVGAEQKLEERITMWRRMTLLKRRLNRQLVLRPYSGFHPLIYAEHHPVACFDQRRYPLSHWIASGMPPGPWAVPVVGPLQAPAASRLKVGLHGHFFYPDLLPELLDRIRVNASRPDLFLTTDTPAKAGELRAMTADYPAAVRIDVVPNLGRDVGPFLTGLRDVLTEGGYDVFFHVHGKKTKGRRRAIGDPWRTFLWENLIGGGHPMLDTVLAHLEAHSDVGLVYPEDSHLVNWARNDRIVEQLRADLALTEPPGTYVDFPVGNMFAIRPAAMAGYLGLDLGWEDYPAEPIPDDGTLMHGLERLLPMAVRKEGFLTAAVRVPGVDWD